ncbi:MAG: carbohydrate-binding family 9-like protein [Opitutaceae bacterium]
MKYMIAFLVFAAWCSGQNPTADRTVATPLPSYEIKRTPKPITVDGKLDEAAWAEAPTLTLQFPWDEQTGAKQKTTARLLWNDEMLFVAFHSEDTDIVAQYEQHDDPTYKDDAVEIFIQPDPAKNVYVGLEINARAVLYDYRNGPSRLEKAYDLKGVQLAVQRDGTLNVSSDRDKSWTIEVAIPLKNFLEFNGGKPVEVGTTWAANLNRWDGTEPNRRLSIWSDSAKVLPNPHNPARFGRLVFGK